MNRSKKVLTMLLAGMMTVTMTACGGSGNSASQTSGDKAEGSTEKVNIALMTTGFVLPISYAIEQGYMEELGLDVNVEYFSNGPAINEAIAAGDIDFGGIGEMPSITGAITNHSKLVGYVCDDQSSIQGYARNESDLVAAGSGNAADHPELYGSAETWSGKSVICAKGTSSHYGLLATLDAFGLTEKDIEFVNMDGASGASAFASNTGDVFFGFDPQWAEFYMNPDTYTQVSTCEKAGRSLGDVLIASEDFCTNHAEALTKILKAVIRAQEELSSDETLRNKAMYDWQSSYGSCTEELAAYSASLKPFYGKEELKALFDESQGTSPMMESIESVAQFMLDNEVIREEDKAALDENGIIDVSFLMAAIGE